MNIHTVKKSLEEKIKKLEEDSKVEKLFKKLHLSWLYEIGDWINWYWKGFIKQLLIEPKYAWQRVKRGYSDRDCWEIDYYLASIIPLMVRQLKRDASGYPQELGNYSNWQKVLEKIAKGFEASIKINDCEFMDEVGNNYKYNQGKHNELKKEMDEGFKLFHEYFLGLWN